MDKVEMSVHYYMYPNDLIVHEEIKSHNNWEVGVAWIDLTPRGWDADPFKMHSVFLNGQWIVTIAPLHYWLRIPRLLRRWVYAARFIKTVWGRYKTARMVT